MAGRPNILFLLSDEHSHRHLSALPVADGGEPVRTPTLDGLIAQGCWLQRAYCQMPLCTPSRLCLLTGRHAEDCGAWNNGSVLRDDLPTFADTLGSAGYATCTAGKLHLGGRRQKAGFQHRPYGDFLAPHCGHQADPLTRPGLGCEGLATRTADAGPSQIPESLLQERMVTGESLSWLRDQTDRAPEQPWLLFASFSRPHFPLTAPRRHLDRYPPDQVPPPRVGRTGDSADHPLTLGMVRGFQVERIDHAEQQRARAAYFACVDTLDEILGDFLALLGRDGLLDNTIIVYASDHGELAGEHGLWWKHSWHEAASRVPLIVSLPEHRRGVLPATRVNAPVSLADLFPTFAGWAGAATPAGLVGADLGAAVAGGAPPTRLAPVTCANLIPRWGAGTEFRMTVVDQHKYIAFRDAPDLCFDLATDPLEQVDLVRRGAVPAGLRDATVAGFDFAAAETRRRADETAAREPILEAAPITPNQIRLGDGRLVEADATLYQPRVICADVDAVFD